MSAFLEGRATYGGSDNLRHSTGHFQPSGASLNIHLRLPSKYARLSARMNNTWGEFLNNE